MKDLQPLGELRGRRRRRRRRGRVRGCRDTVLVLIDGCRGAVLRLRLIFLVRNLGLLDLEAVALDCRGEVLDLCRNEHVLQQRLLQLERADQAVQLLELDRAVAAGVVVELALRAEMGTDSERPANRALLRSRALMVSARRGGGVLGRTMDTIRISSDMVAVPCSASFHFHHPMNSLNVMNPVPLLLISLKTSSIDMVLPPCALSSITYMLDLIGSPDPLAGSGGGPGMVVVLTSKRDCAGQDRRR